MGNLSSYNYETANWKNIKTSLKQVKWNEILEKCDSSEEKITKIIEIVMKIIENNTSKFKCPRGSQINKIPRDRKILLRKRKLISKLIRCYTNKKNNIENAIANIDKKLLKSHKDEKIESETRAIKYIKTNPKHFFTYTKKKLKTKSSIGPFRINEEIFNTALDICGKLSEQYE